MTYFEDDFFELDDRGLSGFDRLALNSVDGFLEKLMLNARIYRLSGTDVMCLNQVRQVALDFLRVDYDGHVRISAMLDDGIGMHSSVLEVTPRCVVFGVTGIDATEQGGEPYDDVFFVVGEGQENDNLDEDLEIWEEGFFDRLTRPGSKITVEGEINNIREAQFKAGDSADTDVDDDDPDNDDDQDNGLIEGWD